MIVEEDELEGGDAATDIADQTLQSILTNIQSNNNSGNPDANAFKVSKCSVYLYFGNHELEGGDAATDIADQTLQSILTNIQTNNNSGNPDANGFKVRKC